MKDSLKKNKKIPQKNKSSRSILFFSNARKYLVVLDTYVRFIFQRYFNNIYYILPILSLLILLLVLAVYNAALTQQIQDTKILPPTSIQYQAYPLIDKTIFPEITAESAIIIDDTAKVTIYEKKPILRFSMASTTKIMTALVALDHFRDNDVLTIMSSHTEGALVGFPLGKQVRFEDVLYGMLLPSGNDAAYAIAENFPGGIEAFIAAMNDKAKNLGLAYTHYVDPAGLDDDGNYTTVNDLAHLASYAIKNPEFVKVTSTKMRIVRTIDNSNVYEIYNLNKLLGENGVTGMKTGYTEGAGEVLVTTKQERGHTFILVVMKSQNRFEDTKKLLFLISDNVRFIKPLFTSY